MESNGAADTEFAGEDPGDQNPERPSNRTIENNRVIDVGFMTDWGRLGRS